MRSWHLVICPAHFRYSRKTRKCNRRQPWQELVQAVAVKIEKRKQIPEIFKLVEPKVQVGIH
jgi:hypothetical protein